MIRKTGERLQRICIQDFFGAQAVSTSFCEFKLAGEEISLNGVCCSILRLSCDDVLQAEEMMPGTFIHSPVDLYGHMKSLL